MRQVLIIRTNQLVAVGLESLLMQEPGLEVKIVILIDAKSIRKELDAFRPDVLILDDGLLLPDPSMLFDLIKEFSNLRVIVIDTSSNKLYVYDKHNVMVEKASDLIAAIR